MANQPPVKPPPQVPEPPPPDQVLAAAAGMFNAGMGIVTSVAENGASLPADLPNLEGPVKAILESLGGQVRSVLDQAYKVATAPAPPPALHPAVDATQVLESIMKGIAAAETALNKSANLAIVSGTVEADLVVRVPGGGAQTRITLQIHPKPYS